MKLAFLIFFTLMTFNIDAQVNPIPCDCMGEAGYRHINKNSGQGSDPIGGCVGPNAFVGQDVFISTSSEVCGETEIAGNSKVLNCHIKGSIYFDSSQCQDSIIGGEVEVEKGSRIRTSKIVPFDNSKMIFISDSTITKSKLREDGNFEGDRIRNFEELFESKSELEISFYKTLSSIESMSTTDISNGVNNPTFNVVSSEYTSNESSKTVNLYRSSFSRVSTCKLKLSGSAMIYDRLRFRNMNGVKIAPVEIDFASDIISHLNSDGSVQFGTSIRETLMSDKITKAYSIEFETYTNTINSYWDKETDKFLPFGHTSKYELFFSSKDQRDKALGYFAELILNCIKRSSI